MRKIMCGNLEFWVEDNASKASIGRRLIELDIKLNPKKSGLSELTEIDTNEDFTIPKAYIATLVLLKAGGAKTINLNRKTGGM